MSKSSKCCLLVSDVDDTLLGDEHALAELAKALEAVRGQIVLAYNSSRPCASLKKSLAEHENLSQPDYLIGALGTEMEHFGSGEAVSAYSHQLADSWRRDEIAALMSKLGYAAHDREFQTPFKASYHVPGHEQYLHVLDQLDRAGIVAKVIYSGNKDLDIIPAGADKGKAVEFLRRLLGFDVEQVLVAGDSANDREMFLYPFKGIIVANADDHMKALHGPNIYHSQACHAAGVLEGLRHWGVLHS